MEIVARKPHFIRTFAQVILTIILLGFSSSSNARQSKVLNAQGDKIFSNLTKSIEKSRVKNTTENFEQLNKYRKLYLEQEKLEYFCRENTAANYFKNSFERDEFYRTMVASLQYKMMNYSMHAIAQYAKKLEFDSEQYDNLVTGLVNSCSQNITLFGHKLMRFLFKKYYKSDRNLILPADKREALFDKSVKSIQSENEILVNELYFTTGIFKYACSWGGQVKYLRKMATLLSSSVVMSYIIREMTNNDSYVYDDFLNDKTVGLCKNQVCRKRKIDSFMENIVRPIGSGDLSYDFKLAYCQKFKYASEKYSPVVSENLKNDLKEFDGQENRIRAQFIALLTRVPDFNVWTSDSTAIKKYISISNDGLWDFWAKDFLETNALTIDYEEALTMKLDSEANMDFIRKNNWPIINFNVVNGEFDKVTNVSNMISLNFDLKFPRNDIKWLCQTYKNSLIDSDKKATEDVKKRLAVYINESYAKVKDTLAQFTVNADILKVLTDELIHQFEMIDYLDDSNESTAVIKVNVHIAPFALVAIRNKRMILDMAQRDLKGVKSLEVLNNIDSMADEAKK